MLCVTSTFLKHVVIYFNKCLIKSSRDSYKFVRDWISTIQSITPIPSSVYLSCHQCFKFVCPSLPACPLPHPKLPLWQIFFLLSFLSPFPLLNTLIYNMVTEVISCTSLCLLFHPVLVPSDQFQLLLSYLSLLCPNCFHSSIHVTIFLPWTNSLCPHLYCLGIITILIFFIFHKWVCSFYVYPSLAHFAQHNHFHNHPSIKNVMTLFLLIAL